MSPEDMAVHDSEIAALMASIAALEAQAVVDRDEIASLHVALHSARTIGAAIGVLMATVQVTEDDAFGLLKQASQNQNRKLRDVAADVVLTGAITAPPGRSG